MSSQPHAGELSTVRIANHSQRGVGAGVVVVRVQCLRAGSVARPSLVLGADSRLICSCSSQKLESHLIFSSWRGSSVFYTQPPQFLVVILHLIDWHKQNKRVLPNFFELRRFGA